MKRNLILLGLSLLLFACHKKENKPATVQGYSGWFEVQKIIFKYPGSSSSIQEGASVTFYDPPVDFATISPDSLPEMRGTYAGDLQLNGKDMEAEYDEADSSSLLYKAYADYAPWYLDSSLTFQIGGSAGIPSFTYNAPGAIYKFLPGFPDTLNAAAGYTLNLGVAGTGADSISVSISGTSGLAITRNYNTGTSAVTFTAAELSSLGSGYAFINIILAKQEDYETGGKKYYFSAEYMIHWALILH